MRCGVRPSSLLSTDGAFLISLILFVLLTLVLSCAPRPTIRPEASPSPYEEGLIIFQKGEILAAIQEWEKVEARHPHYPRTQEMIRVANSILTELVTLHVQYGSNLEKEGRLSEAVVEYQRALLLDPRREDVEEKMEKVQEILSPLVRYHLKQGHGLEGSGQLQEALKEFRLVLVFDPNNGDAHENSIRLQERIESEAGVHYETGLDHFERREYRLAKGEMESALRLKPDHAGAKCYLDAIERALSSEKRRAEPRGEPLVTLGLKERRLRIQELIAAGDWARARKETKSLVEIDPHDAEAKRLLALSQSRCKERADHLFQQGIRHFQEEDLDSAISAWRQVLILEENHGKAKDFLEKANLMREKIRRIRQERIQPES